MIVLRMIILRPIRIFLPAIMIGLSINAGASDKSTSTTFVRVISETSAGVEHRGSGFVWPDENHVVTAFHVVAGSKTTLIECPVTEIEYREKEVVRKRRASLERVLIDADIALLKLDDPLEVNHIPRIADRFSAGEKLDCWGYPLGIARPGATPVYIRKGSEKNSNVRLLKAIITYQIGEGLQNLGFPDIDAKVIDIEGNLVGGHSGAPILNSSDELVGIGSGGLMEGKIGRAWAIPAFRLPDLLQSKDSPPNLTDIWEAVEGLFVVTLDQANSKLSLGFHINEMDIGSVFSMPESDKEFSDFMNGVREKLSPKTMIPVSDLRLPNGVSITGCATRPITRDSRGGFKGRILTAAGFRIQKEANLFPKASERPYVTGYINGTMIMLAFFRRPIANPQICFTREGRGRDYDLLLICSGGKREILYDNYNSQISVHAPTLEPKISPSRLGKSRPPIRVTDLAGAQIIVAFTHDVNFGVPDPKRYRELFSTTRLLSLHFTVNQQNYVFYTPSHRGNTLKSALELVPYHGPRGTVYSCVIPTLEDVRSSRRRTQR